MINGKTLQSHEGYYLVDHRDSPGIPDGVAIAAGLPPGAGMGGKVFESATFTCPYCNCVVVLNPDRSRPRNYDIKTNHLICDGCAALRALGHELKTMDQLADEVRNAAVKGQDLPIAPQILPREVI